MKPNLVIGLGNPLQGDDGVGCAVAQALQELPWIDLVPNDTEVIDLGTPGIGLINFVQERKHVIIVDAADIGRAAGAFARMAPKEIELARPLRSFSLHAPGVADSLMLAQALQLSLPDIVIFGVQPGFIGWRDALSRPVQLAVPSVAQAVLTELGAYHGE